MAGPVVTAHIRPTDLLRDSRLSLPRYLVIAMMIALTVGGLWLRSTSLSAESLGEDEWKKLGSVEDYRANGLTGTNGEHPFLLKGMLTLSVSAADRWNRSVAADDPSWQIAVETALRFPVALIGALCTIMLFLLGRELFGSEVGLIAAALWAFDPSGIGFARIAKEDTVMTFFFMLANVFLLRSQRVAENGGTGYLKWMWATAAAYGAMMATKYFPHFMAISAAYYNTFQGLPTTEWRLGKRKWLLFLIIVGVSFLIFNVTILLPDTWRAMISFLSENRVGYHVESSYEYLGTIYRNKLTLWLDGVPWHFYYVFMLVKMPLTTVFAIALGLILMFRKELGDGRWFVFWWCFFWFMPFSVLGGKFTRYFVMALPIVLIIAAIGIHWLSRSVSSLLVRLGVPDLLTRNLAFGLMLIVFAAIPLFASLRISPYYRLYTNPLGGGKANAGSYFPHDEFFDARLGEAIQIIAQNAGRGARIFSETPGLTAFHTQRTGRDDLASLWLSDPAQRERMQPGDYIIAARGRRYYSNDAILDALAESSAPESTIYLGDIPAVNLYRLNAATVDAIRSLPAN